MTRPWCAGSRRAVPGLYPHDPDRLASCPECGIRLTTRHTQIPDHRRRVCLAPGCDRHQTAGGLCEFHNRDVVYGETE